MSEESRIKKQLKMRYTIAISILLFAYEEMKRERKFKFLALVLIATLFHNTAIIFIVILLIKK